MNNHDFHVLKPKHHAGTVHNNLPIMHTGNNYIIKLFLVSFLSYDKLKHAVAK